MSIFKRLLPLGSLIAACLLATLASGQSSSPANRANTASMTTMASSQPLPPPDFFKTQDSDEWVRHTFKVQQRYARVLLVSKDANAPESISVSPLDLNARPGSAPAPAIEYKVEKVFPTLQAAADESRGGDLIAVTPGTYDAGVDIGPRPDVGDGKYIHFKALGKPGEVIIHEPLPEESRKVCFRIRGDYIIVQGFNLAGSSGPGQPYIGTLSGFILGNNFARTSQLVHHVAIMESFSHNHWKWGFTSVESHSVLLQDNCFAFSGDEHGAYVSDSSDNYVIRRNVFFGNNKCGLQCNMDADTSLRNLSRHADLAEFRAPRRDHEYAVGLIAAATKRFGPSNFMDGRGINFIIEENVSNGNGRNGGAAFNFSALQESLVQNNLAYGNGNHGMTAYNNSAASFDRTFVFTPPKQPADVKGKESLALFGSCNNNFRNNTLLLAHPDNADRFALGFVNGSYGNRVRNNIAINASDASLEVNSSSIYRHDSGYNVIDALSYADVYVYGTGVDTKPTTMPAALKSLAVNLDEKNHTTSGVTLEKIAPEFVRYGEQPWIVIEGNWWKLNPDRPDFHPKADSKLLVGTADKSDLPPVDLLGQKRTQADIGAFAVK